MWKVSKRQKERIKETRGGVKRLKINSTFREKRDCQQKGFNPSLREDTYARGKSEMALCVVEEEKMKETDL